jgi:hypothetical protein
MAATGTEIRAALKKAQAWGVAAACGANDGVLIMPHTLKKERAKVEDESLGVYFPKELAQVDIKVEGTVPAYLRYDGLDLLLALVMGETAGAPVQQDGTQAYAQSFKLKETIDGLFSTFAVNNGINIDEYTSLKLTGFTLKGEVGKPVQAVFQAIADDRVTDSAVNTPESFAAVTYFEEKSRVLFSQAVFRMNAQAGAALGDGDKIYPSSFELSFKRKMKGIYAAGGADKIDEPTNEGAPEVRLKLDFPRYTAKTYFEDWDRGAAKKLDITFTGALIEGAYYRSFKIQFPNLSLASVDLPIEKGILKHPLEFECLASDAAPLGMTGITKPFQIDVINRQNADVLG